MKLKVGNICSLYDKTKQAFYKKIISSEKKVDHSEILNLVKRIRAKQPKIGGRKLFKIIDRVYKQELNMGRDKFFELLRDAKLLVEKKRSFVRTTNSKHPFYKHKNKIKDLQITHRNQVWVSDITYLETMNGFVYLSLLTDLFSRKIVGYHLAKTLQVEGSIKALQMALSSLSSGEKGIHHSDRGSQYCCKAYTDILESKGFEISMTEENHCYENSVAERVNGILKDEFLLNLKFIEFESAKKSVQQSIEIYNSERPHFSLNYNTPDTIYNGLVA